MKKIVAKFLLLVFTFLIFFPVRQVSAATELKPEFNPLCWQKQDCEEKRAEFFGENKKEGGWLEREAPDCDKEGWGKCIASASTKAQVSFGGRTEFSNVGEYIKAVYNYGLAVIGIVAVVVIIIAGAQWITSAGNAEVIGRAKKRITGAVIGIFIAYMSYAILQTINPATVNLRLPQVYMIREMVLPSKWCRDFKPEQAFAYAASHKNQSDELEPTGNEYFNLYYPFKDPSAETFWCGQRFYIDGGAPDAFCLGDRCNKGTICTDVNPVDEKNPYMCRKSFLGGTITKGSGDVALFEKWEYPWANNGELMILCNDGDDSSVSDDVVIRDDDAKQSQSYLFNVSLEEIEEAVQDCADKGGVKGFYVYWEFEHAGLAPEDEQHRVGASGSKGIDLGYSGFYDWDDSYYEDLEHLLPQYLISETQLLSGMTINIEVSDVCRWVGAVQGDDDKCELGYYKYFEPK